MANPVGPQSRSGDLSMSEDLAATELCRYCLMCRHVCPVGLVTHQEALTPHGWALIIASVKRGLLEWNAESVETLYKCADCGLCRAHCVTDQPLPAAIASTRSDLVRQGQAPPSVYAVEERLRAWQNLYRESPPTPVKSQGETALFVGDAGQYLSPETVTAAQHLLEACGVEPVLVGQGLSNGLIANSLGLMETAQSLAQRVLEEVSRSQCRRLVVLAPGDLYTFKHVYPERLGLEWPPEIETVELCPILSMAQEEGKLQLRPREDIPNCAYLDPDHAARCSRDHEAPRQLLKAVLGKGQLVELFWCKERAHPAGSCGGLSETHPELALQLTEARIQDAVRAGAQCVVTEDPLLLDTLSGFRFPVPSIRGLYPILAEQLEG